MTRVDIAYVVGVLCRFSSKPTQVHLTAAKHVLRYLAGTTNYALRFTPGNSKDPNTDSPIVAFTDASWANDLVDRKSTTGTIVKLFGNPVCWLSKKQPTTALSSAEAEYMALSATLQEILWIRQWIKEVLNIDTTTPIYSDSQSAVAMTKHDVSHQRTKHIDIRHHFIRDHVKLGNVSVTYIPTGKQQADILTKCVVTKQFITLTELLLSTSLLSH
jgi:ribonuclease HI